MKKDKRKPRSTKKDEITRSIDSMRPSVPPPSSDAGAKKSTRPIVQEIAPIGRAKRPRPSKPPAAAAPHIASPPAAPSDEIPIDDITDETPIAPSVPPPPISTPELREQIRTLEKEIDERISASQPRIPEAGPSGMLPDAVFETARELLSTDYYLRQWGRIGMRNRSEEVDDFGFDPIYEKKLRPLFDFLYQRYFRVASFGTEHIPSEGRCLLVANHSGTIPHDGIMIKTAVKREHPSARDLRWLAEDSVFHFPFLGSISNRIGAVRACQENAERLLKQEALVAVFPEGIKGIEKLYRDRYKLQRFGRGGYIKLCLRTNTPIIPVAVIGGEETNPMLFRVEAFKKLLGFPYVPITPTFPWLGPLGLMPLPAKWSIYFGEKITLEDYRPSDAEDEVLVSKLSERVRASIQEMLARGLSERAHAFLG